ncbi:Fc.00g099870.m01.CDS01 [Cosmosporella sp. VM-42]
MSNRHLPAGQNIQGGAGGVPGVDMAGGPGGPRRRQPPPYVPMYHQQHMNPLYANYNPYGPQQYYGMPPQYNGQYQTGQYQTGQYQNGQYQNGQYQTGQYQPGGMPSPGYMPYPNYARSPPSMHQYVPMVGVSVPPNYPRPAQQSPALSTPYQPPLAPAPLPSHTPSSTHSSQLPPPPTPPTPQTQAPLPPVVPAIEPTPVEPTPVQPAPIEPTVEPTPIEPAPIEVVEAVVVKEPFKAPLPWLSRPELEFPAKTTRSRRRRKLLNADSEAVSLPIGQHEAAVEQAEISIESAKTSAKMLSSSAQADASFLAGSETSSTQQQRFEEPVPATPTTPSSTQRSRTDTTTSATSTKASKTPTRPAIPVPVVPALPKPSPKDAKPARAEKPLNGEATGEPARPTTASTELTPTAVESESGATEPVSGAPSRAPPSSWANLFAKASAGASGGANGPNGPASGAGSVNGHGSEGANGVNGSSSNFSKTNSSSVAEAIQAYRVGGSDKISFLEPRGLINTGNMCYMNSVLQVLMFCVPFYDFLSQVSKRAVHSFKSDTPLIDAMIMFMHEYKVIKSAPTVEPLRRALKNEELERYGEPFTPEFVYEAIRQLPRFASMRRGHQQDAEEFLGFLLQSLDDECTSVMGSSILSHISEAALSSGTIDGDHADPSGDWLEVGRKQRAAVTRSSGSSTSTPLTKIFGGLLRSEFRVPGLKDSITTEPYQPLQLDIGSSDVRNVVDALRGLTRPERLQGDFNSPRGKDVVATKQVFIESLPPVLILHLKRFQFDAEGNGTVKIWKKIGYPLELEIPREALSRQKRQTLGEGSMPKYKLISVVYHHGKNASGGHYTVDVRRQDGREWIRLDDTVIRRVRSEDVAEGGEEEDVKDSRQESSATAASGNRFGAMNDEDTGDEDGWKQVTASAGGNKRWSSVVNGTGSASTKGKQVKDSIKDNKVAYLLFYQRV